jgi:hypothetical protein
VKPVSKVETAARVKARLRDHADWWREHRQGSKWTVTKAVRTAYSEIKRNPEVGMFYDDARAGIRFIKTATDHALYYIVVDADPKPYVLVIGVKGPWEESPYLVAG